MPTQRHSRPVAFGHAVSSTSLSIVRILIASYFLATATRLVNDPASESFLARVMDPQTATLLATLYLFPTAFFVMVGYAVRPAALLLSVYVFWASFSYFDNSQGAEALDTLWRNTALLGGLMLVAMTTPGGSREMRLRNRPVIPRRVHPASRITPSRPAAPVSAPLGSPSADWSAANRAMHKRHTRPLPDDTAAQPNDNIFRDDWDIAPQV